MRKTFLTFGKPDIGKKEIAEVVGTLKSGWLSTGPKVGKFENDFKNYVGSKYAVGLNSCTAGLHLALLVTGIVKDDEVITSPMTFGSTANVIIHSGAKPIFVDVDIKTMNIDTSLIKKKITKRTKAIIPVHMAGRPCDMEAINKIAREYGLYVIDDAAHAVGAKYKGRMIGNCGDLTCFSFYATKNITTGEGGMVTTNNGKWADAMKILSLHGLSRHAWQRYGKKGKNRYDLIMPGYKYNMMDIQASIGIHQLRKLEDFLKRREEIWKRYDNVFIDLPLKIPSPIEYGNKHARHLYTILLNIERLKVNRDVFAQMLNDENIGTGIHFISLHLHRYYAKIYGYKPGDFPNAFYISERTLSLPLTSGLTNEDVTDVIKAVKKVIDKTIKK